MSYYVYSKWCEDSMDWLQKLWREHGDAAGIHELDGYEFFEGGTPDVVHPYWAHVVKDFRLLDQAQVKEICPDAAHGFAFRTIIYTPKYALTKSPLSASTLMT